MQDAQTSICALRGDWRSEDEGGLAVTAVTENYPAGHVVSEHRHRRYQLLYAASGLMVVEASTGRWVVPPTMAVWLQPGVVHRLVMRSRVRVYGVFVSEASAGPLPMTDSVLRISPLMRALIGELASSGMEDPHSRRRTLQAALLLEELAVQRALPFHLPWPEDARILRVCNALADDPAHPFSADEWAASLAMSPKTFYRHFQRTSGMAFGRWRQQLRLLSSLPVLLDGAGILQVALGCGYASHSAYAVAFKKHFGVSPSGFLAASRG